MENGTEDKLITRKISKFDFEISIIHINYEVYHFICSQWCLDKYK